MPTTDLPKADQMPLSLRAAAVGVRSQFGDHSGLADLLDEAADHIEATWANYRKSNEQARRLSERLSWQLQLSYALEAMQKGSVPLDETEKAIARQYLRQIEARVEAA